MPQVVRWVKKPKVSFHGTPGSADQTHHYTAILDTPGSNHEATFEVLNYSECPAYYSKLSGTDLFVNDIRIDQDGDQEYTVNVTYTNTLSSDGKTGLEGTQITFVGNPLQRPALIDWGTYQTREVFETTYDENNEKKIPVVTAVGEPLILEDEIDRRVILIQKNVPSVKPFFATNANFINKDNVRIAGINFKPKTLWLTKLSISPLQYEGGVLFYILSFQLYHREETWEREIRHAGYYYRESLRDAAGNEVLGRSLPILVNKTFPAKPTPLEANGTISIKMAKYLGMIPTTPEERANIFTAEEIAEIWKRAKLKFMTKRQLFFTNNVPLK